MFTLQVGLFNMETSEDFVEIQKNKQNSLKLHVREPLEVSSSEIFVGEKNIMFQLTKNSLQVNASY